MTGDPRPSGPLCVVGMVLGVNLFKETPNETDRLGDVSTFEWELCETVMFQPSVGFGSDLEPFRCEVAMSLYSL